MEINNDFGYDFLYTMEVISFMSSGNKCLNLLASGASIFFLTEWGFLKDQAAELQQKLMRDWQSGNLAPPSQSFERLANQVKGNSTSMGRLIMQSIAIAYIVTKGEIPNNVVQLLLLYQNLFDYKPPEFTNLIEQGVNMCEGLFVFARIYDSVEKGEIKTSQNT